VLDLWNQNVLRAVGEHLDDEENAAVAAHLEATLEHGLSSCLVAQDVPGAPLDGFVTTHLLGHSTFPGYVGMVEELFVHPDRRRRGIGRMLVERALAQLRAGGADHFRIEVAPEDREAAGLFAAIGWEPSLLIFSHYDDV
jgi:ribosomal protein S18 acetylase RimI-like enzyme